MRNNQHPLLQPDLVCFSHLRWDFVYQRPQHLLTRCAQDHRVFFVEEPIFGNGSMRLDMRERDAGVRVVVPHLPEGLRSEVATTAIMKEMIRRLFLENGIRDYVFWYYTPMAVSFTDHLSPVASVYDCMDELSTFKGAHPLLPELEQELFQCVDLVFTGGQSLYEAKRRRHPDVYLFPSSIDVAHFRKARTITTDAEDQVAIPNPRLGFFGVIDERFDIDLLNAVATKRPDWHFVIIGPVVKIDPGSLPKHRNIHYLGPKKYDELPTYLANWNIALLLFARNESTRYISPTKTPEYLAAGKPVISTPIRDVVRPYGELDLVHVAETPGNFIQAAELLLSGTQKNTDWLAKVDDFLGKTSWDTTWDQMSFLLNQVIEKQQAAKATPATIMKVKQRASTTAGA